MLRWWQSRGTIHLSCSLPLIIMQADTYVLLVMKDFLTNKY